MALFVIVHGGWSGGWYFQSTARLMRAAGHEVYTPTLTGIGERVHLAHADVDLSLHIQDVVNVLEFEEMHEVVLVGYSYGGMVVTGVADRIPQRISQIIYLDAFVPENGQSVADLDAMRNEGKETDIPIIDGWRVPHYPPQPRKTDHPIKTFTQAIRLTNPAESLQLPRTYVRFAQTAPPITPQVAESVRTTGWRYRELDVGHLAPETHSQEVAAVLMELA